MHLGYEVELVEKCPNSILDVFCGVGNPFSLGAINEHDKVLDVGCGGGFDLYVTLQTIGEKGSVTGVDLSMEMVEKARTGLAQFDQDMLQLHHLDTEKLPFEDGAFDVIISNGVFNLSPQKLFLFKELFRVLVPGGEIRFADVIQESALPSELVGSIESWSN